MDNFIVLKTHKYIKHANSYIELLKDKSNNYYVRVHSNNSSYTTQPTGKYSAEYMFERHIDIAENGYARIGVR